MVKRLSQVDQNSNKIVNVPAPTSNGDAVNKQYADGLVANKVTGVNTNKVTVSITPPVSPVEGDIWINIG